MNLVAIQPTIWNKLPDVNAATGFSKSEAECLKEIRDVLKRHGQIGRFGISLLHERFDIAEDEMLLETTDEQERTQLIRPVKVEEYKNRKDLSIMTTALKFVDGNSIAVQRCACIRDKDGHTCRHQVLNH